MKATGQVPLNKDLSNAIIATCKSYKNPSRAEVRRYKENERLQKIAADAHHRAEARLSEW